MDHDDLLDQVLALARGAGADAADCLIAERTSLDVAWRLGALEELERKQAREIGLRVLVGRRVATVATTRTDAATLRSLVEDTVAAARLLPEDAWAGLAAPDELATRYPELELVDPDEPSVDSLQAAAAAAEDAARAVPGITNSEGASASWSHGRIALGASNGFRGSMVRTRHGLGATVLAGTGTAMQRDYVYRQTTHRGDLPSPEEIGREAGERAARRVEPRKVATQRVPVVYEPRAATGLLRHLATAIGGDAVASGRSFLKDRLGEPVFAPGVMVTDDPLRPRGLASRPFDGEGIGGATRRLIDGGILTGWLLDLATGRRLGMASTGHASRSGAALGGPSATNLTLAAGSLSPEALIADIAQGFYVTELMGMGVNTVTGDYSRGASGFWIERGRITHPVSEVTVAGNLAQMFKALTPASDLEIRGSTDAPTVRIDGLTVAGT
ncbi:MAG: TldD/PmbA family protein [Geminicoccaceae bacterium]